MPTQDKRKNLGEKFGNIEKILEILRIDGEYPAGLPKGKFDSCPILVVILSVILRKLNCVKSVEKFILLDFVNLSTTYCPRLYV